MDSKEDILSALDEFNQQGADKVPLLLERYLNRIAATGETLFAWAKLRPLFLHKLNLVMKEFFEKVPTDDLPTCPNVENVKFEEIRQRLVMTINEFNGAPFTIQRLCELITNPWKHYKRTDKFMRGLEKNLLVVSTVDPYGNKIVHEASTVLVNGLDANGYETDKVSPEAPDRSFFPPPVPCSSPNTNGTGIHGAGDASTSSSSSPSSSWFASSSVADSPCPWSGDSTAVGMVENPCVEEPSASSAALSSSSLEEGARSESDSSPLEPPLPTSKDTDMSESSSESSGSSSSEHSITPPLEDLEKDSDDSSLSAKALQSSCSDSSHNEAEAEQPEPESSESIEATTEVAIAETPPEPEPEPEPLAIDPVSTSIPEEGAASGKVTVTEEQEETDIVPDENRESIKRSIDQDHTETQNKRLRVSEQDEDDNDEECNEDVSQSSQVESSSESQAKCTAATTPPLPECDVDQSAADSQSRDEAEKQAPMDDDSAQREAQPAGIQEGRDSQDSLGFDTPVRSDSEAAPVEESATLSSASLKTEAEEAATSSTSPTPNSDSESPDSGSKPDEPELVQEAADTDEAAPCEVSGSDQSVHSAPDQTVEDKEGEDSVSVAHQGESPPRPEEPSSSASSSASGELRDTKQGAGEHTRPAKVTVEDTTPEPESTSQSEDNTQISQSEDACESSLQTEACMEVN